MGNKRKRKPTRRQRLHRWQKNLIHGGLLTAILVSLYYEGGKQLDYLFFALSVATEVV